MKFYVSQLKSMETLFTIYNFARYKFQKVTTATTAVTNTSTGLVLCDSCPPNKIS